VERLLDLTALRKVTVGVGYVYRMFPALLAMREAIHSGRFGRPVQIVATGGQHFPTYRPAYRSIYYNDHKTGGGAIQDAITHILNAGEWLVGPVERLCADAAHQVLDGVEVEDTVHVLTRQGSVLGCYSLNQHQAPNEMVITVVCERGTCKYESHRNTWSWVTDPGGPWNEQPLGAMEGDTPFITQANAFLDAVEGKRPVPCTLAEGVQTLRVNLAALASVRKGIWQTV
jgi:predicted dehydrogenase